MKRKVWTAKSNLPVKSRLFVRIRESATENNYLFGGKGENVR